MILINWLKKYFVTRAEYLKYMQAQNKLMELHTKELLKMAAEKNDYKTFSEELNKITKR